MALRERSFRDFYNKRQASHAQRMRSFRPVLNNNEERWEQLNKSNEIYARELEQKTQDTQKREKAWRTRNTLAVKLQLDKQVESKHRLRQIQFLREAQEQQEAKKQADLLRTDNDRALQRRLQQQRELRTALDSQLREKRRASGHTLTMNTRERQMHYSFLHRKTGDQEFAFPGVPGAHISETPFQRNFEKIYSYSMPPSQFSAKKHSPSTEKNDFYRNLRKFFNGEENSSGTFLNRESVDPSKHDPIVNPIGAYWPKAVLGHRIVRSPRHHSTLSKVGNSVVGFSNF